MAITLEIFQSLLIRYMSNIKGYSISIPIIKIMAGKENATISLLENNLEECIQAWSLTKIKEVLEVLDYHYNNGTALVSDTCYDTLDDYYHSQINQPRTKIGAPVPGEKVRLPIHMGSMDKVKPGSSELNRYFSEYKNDKCVMDKLDGVSLLLDLTKEGHPRAFTRGNGTYGKNVTDKIPYIEGLKHVQSLVAGATGYVRGELIVPNNKWHHIKDTTANARNFVSGIINRKTIVPEQLQYIHFVAYEWNNDAAGLFGLKLPITGQFEMLYKIGLNVVKHKVYKGLSAEQLPGVLTEFKSTSDYEIDGIIIQDNVYYPRNNSKNPKYAKAFKMDSMNETAVTTVKQVHWNASKKGALKPVVEFEKVQLDGVSITNASGYNANYIETQGIGEGAVIEIIRSGSVIPKIIKVITKATVQLPKDEYTWDKNHTDIVLVDKKGSSEVAIKQLEYFITTLGIQFFKSGLIKKAYAKGCTTIYDILYIDKQQLLDYQLDGVKEKSAIKIADSIHDALHSASVGTLAAATPYFNGMGVRRMNAIETNIPTWLELSNDDLKVKVLALDGFSELMWANIMNGLDEFKSFYKVYLKEGYTTPATVKQPFEKVISNKLHNRVFVFTGFRSKDLEKIIKTNGGMVSERITKKNGITDLIVPDENYTNAKLSKAKEAGIHVLTKQSFLDSL